MYQPNTDAIRAEIARLQALLDTPPHVGYSDGAPGYRVTQLVANNHPALWESPEEQNQLDPSDRKVLDDLIDPANPYHTITADADGWEDITRVIESQFDHIEGMTQAFLVVRY